MYPDYPLTPTLSPAAGERERIHTPQWVNRATGVERTWKSVSKRREGFPSPHPMGRGPG